MLFMPRVSEEREYKKRAVRNAGASVSAPPSSLARLAEKTRRVVRCLVCEPPHAWPLRRGRKAARTQRGHAHLERSGGAAAQTASVEHKRVLATGILRQLLDGHARQEPRRLLPEHVSNVVPGRWWPAMAQPPAHDARVRRAMCCVCRVPLRQLRPEAKGLLALRGLRHPDAQPHAR